ncbi:MAG: hypothetical protein M1339_08315, partial [Bacteroidetes bacterium]|nr:hypothetical protein [Bacteroidota bacterium]
MHNCYDFHKPLSLLRHLSLNFLSKIFNYKITGTARAMIESDYIVRMFTLLGRALAKITLLKETKNAGLLKETKEYEEAAGEVEQASRDLLGLTVEMMRRLPIADLHKLFGSDPAIA